MRATVKTRAEHVRPDEVAASLIAARLDSPGILEKSTTAEARLKQCLSVGFDAVKGAVQELACRCTRRGHTKVTRMKKEGQSGTTNLSDP